MELKSAKKNTTLIMEKMKEIAKVKCNVCQQSLSTFQKFLHNVLGAF